MPDIDYDVVISGYGPTGLAAASLLARRGHRVCVFERWPSLYGLPRMATIDGESARIIQAAADIDQALRNSEPRRRYILANGDGEILIDMNWDTPDVSGFPHRISLHQPDIEDAMDAAARAHGAEINQGWEVVALTQDDARVTVTARERIVRDGAEPAWGRERRVTARYVIGADGARSAGREALGIERESWPFRAAWLSCDMTRKRPLPNFWGLSPDARIAVIFCAPAGRAHSIIPLGRAILRLNFQVDPDAPPADALTRAAAYRYLKSVYGLTEDDVTVYRQAVYPFEGKLARRWREGRVFLAGDAAHVMTPFLGQGGCSALRDAMNLAWKLDLVLRPATRCSIATRPSASPMSASTSTARTSSRPRSSSTTQQKQPRATAAIATGRRRPRRSSPC
jgi:3-(3-hydroxy-phenyl)propionate hydroxylase